MLDPITGKEAHINHHIAGTIDQEDSKTLHNTLSYKKCRLEQGYDTIKGTHTIVFIPVSAIPNNTKAAYPPFVCDIRANKEQKHCVRRTVAG